MSDPVDPRAELVKNLFLLQRAGNTVNDGVRQRVNALFDELAGLIAKIDPVGPALQRYRIARAEKLFREIRELTGEAFAEVTKEVRVQLASLGQTQATAATIHLQAVLGTEGAGEVEVVKATLNQMKALIDQQPMQGALLKDWFAKQGRDTAFRVQRQIQLGMVNAEGVGDIIERVRGRTIAGGRVVGGVLQTTAREAEAVVRTAVNHVSNAAAELTFAQNTDIIAAVEWTCALDGRTCMQCAPLDGKTWKLDDASRPRPPLHMNDRCILVPVPDWAGLGLDPPPSGTRSTALDPATGKPGQVSSDLRYEDWLKAQPAGVQNEILGPSRAQVFRDGKVSLADMVRTDGGRVPLADLDRAKAA